VIVATSADETRAVARSLAELLGPGDVVLLSGGLGVGKTTFAKGLAAGLGVTDEVVSPTFTLARSYDDGRLPLVHVDVYRLGTEQEVLDLGLDDLVGDDGVLVVEWGDVAAGALGEERLEVRLVAVGDGDDREITMTPVGAAWRSRRDALAGLGAS
jgi:tRNA threonylcarbamoyladenosine biosynthesis protein TsaE